MAMMAIEGICAEYGVQRLNRDRLRHRRVELLLPTYAESLGEGKICSHWALNPHPALIPAIEAGWVKSVHSFGSEMGMEDYIRARPDVFFTGRTADAAAAPSARRPVTTPATCSSEARCDRPGRQRGSTATLGRIAGFGSAPNRAPTREVGITPARRLKAGRQTATASPARATRRAAEAGRADGRDLPRAWSRRSSKPSTPGSWPSRRRCRCRRS
jgi:malonate decarboxylase alpha subunit